MPGIEEMIVALEQVDPPGVGTQLRALKDGTWRPMSSFVHGGIFALHERVRDLPEPWRTHTLRNSNGLSVMAAMTFATCTAAGVNPGAIQAIQIRFLDCGPDVVQTP